MNIKRYIINWLLRNLYKATVLEEILTIQKDKEGKVVSVFINGEALKPNEVANIKQEALMIEKMRIWQILNDTLEEDAKQRMFTQSKSWEDMNFGKAMLYNKSIENNIITLFKNI